MELSIKLLGGFQVSSEHGQISDFRSDRERALLAYLAMEPDRPHSRQELMTLLWPDHDPDRARNNLRVSLHRLRKALAPDADQLVWLEVTTTQVTLFSDPMIRVDAIELEHFLLETTDPTEDPGEFQRIVNLYRGDFLQGFDLDDSVTFSDWISIKREGLHRLVLRALHTLGDYYLQRGKLKEALQSARRQIELESWREEAHYQLMKGLALGGEHSAALAQYQLLEQTLDVELGISPSPESSHLRDVIQTIHDSDDPPPLPATLNHFIGRERELSHIADQLADSNVRLLTLLGPGGIGKSRLALEAARRARQSRLHGVRWINLLTIDDPGLLPFLIADALDIFIRDNGSPEQPLIDYLRNKEMLLVLDNFEHVVDGAPFLVPLLKHTDHVKILVTSRERLMVRGEYVLQVDGMLEDTPLAVDSDGVRLFVESAKRVNPAFDLKQAGVSEIVALCQLIHGMPLAIELAASWTSTLSPARITVEIERSPGFLADRDGSQDERHISLQAVFDQTWKRLSDKEQGILTDLTIFPDSFDIEAAEAVARVDLHVLARLVDKSLIQLRTLSDGLTIYVFHPLIRQFAHNRLSEERSKTLLKAHSHYFFGLASNEYQYLRSSETPAALRRVHRIYPDLSLALETGSPLLDEDSARAILDVLMFYHEIYGRYREAEAQFQLIAANLLERSGLESAITHAQAFHGWYLMRRGRYEEAYSLGTQALDNGLSQNDPDNVIIGYDICALVNISRGNLEDAAEQLSMALATANDSENIWWSGSLNLNLSRVFLLKGDLHQAQTYVAAGMKAHRSLGDYWGIGQSLDMLGQIKFLLGELEEAMTIRREQIALAQTIGHRWGVAKAHTALGDIARQSGDYTTAHEEYRQGLILSRDIGERRHVALSLARLGAANLALGETEDARDYLGQALQLALEIEEQDVFLEGVLYLTQLLIRLDDHQQAHGLFSALSQLNRLPAHLEPLFSEISHLVDPALDGHDPAVSLENLVLSMI